MFGFGESPPANVIELLIADHRRVDGLFKEFEKENDGARKVALASEICNELSVHAAAEEDILYPRALAAFEAAGKSDDKELIWEATVEHGTLEGLIASLAGVAASDDAFDAHVKVLKEYVKHHVKEEEGEMFPKLHGAGLDLVAMRDEVAAHKQALMRRMGLAKRGGGKR